MAEFGKVDLVESKENNVLTKDSILSERVVGELVDLRAAGLLDPVKTEDKNFIEKHPVTSAIAGASALAAGVYLARRGKAGVLANKADDLVKLELTGLPASKPLAQLNMLDPARAERFQRVVNGGVPITPGTVNMANLASIGIPMTQRTINIAANLSEEVRIGTSLADSIKLAVSGAAVPLVGGKYKFYDVAGNPQWLDNLVKFELTGAPAGKSLVQFEAPSAAKLVSTGIPKTDRNVRIMASITEEGTHLGNKIDCFSAAARGVPISLADGKHFKLFDEAGKAKIVDIKDLDAILANKQRNMLLDGDRSEHFRWITSSPERPSMMVYVGGPKLEAAEKMLNMGGWDMTRPSTIKLRILDIIKDVDSKLLP